MRTLVRGYLLLKRRSERPFQLDLFWWRRLKSLDERAPLVALPLNAALLPSERLERPLLLLDLALFELVLLLERLQSA